MQQDRIDTDFETNVEEFKDESGINLYEYEKALEDLEYLVRFAKR